MWGVVRNAHIQEDYKYSCQKYLSSREGKLILNVSKCMTITFSFCYLSSFLKQQVQIICISLYKATFCLSSKSLF